MKLIPHTDLFTYPGDVRVITVNTVGAMGTGIAETFRDRYMKVYWEYKKQCRGGYFHIGVPQFVVTEDGLKWLLFPTKMNWRNPSQYEWIHAGLQYLIDNIGEPDYIQHDWSLVFPPLGCGHGWLNFDNIKRLMQMFDDHIPNDVTLIAPKGYAV
jgi:hypothetical protein